MEVWSPWRKSKQIRASSDLRHFEDLFCRAAPQLLFLNKGGSSAAAPLYRHEPTEASVGNRPLLR